MLTRIIARRVYLIVRRVHRRVHARNVLVRFISILLFLLVIPVRLIAYHVIKLHPQRARHVRVGTRW